MNAATPSSMAASSWARISGPLITLVLAAVIQWLSVTALRVPNPPAFLLLSIVLAAFHGGLPSGLISAGLAWAYILFFFSIEGQPFTYTDENLRRVVVWAITMPATAIMVGILKRRAEDAAQLGQANTFLQAQIAERERTEAALRASQAMSHGLFESAPDAIIVVNREGNIVRINAQAERMLGYRREELIGRSVEVLLPERFMQRHADHRTRYMAEPRARPMGTGLELFGRRKDGSDFPADITLGPLETDEGLVVLATVRDVTERKRAEEILRKLNRTLKTVSDCNQALVRASDESDLIRNVCRILVEVGGYRLAWVGFAEADEEHTVRPVGQWGYEEGYLDSVKITWADTGRDRGPTGTAIRTRKPSVAQDTLTDPHLEPWRAEAIQRGYASSIALPLLIGEDSVGALNVYATTPHAFDPEEVKLLAELATDLSYGITALRTRAEHQRAEAESRLLQTTLVAVSEADDLDSALTIVLRKVCDATEWALGQAWVPREDGAALALRPAWYSRVQGVESFRTATVGVSFVPACGPLRHAWLSKEPAWHPDVTKDPDFLRAASARDAGLKAGFWIPVLAGPRVLAVLEFFAVEAREEDRRLVSLVSTLSTQLASVIQRKQAEEALRQSREMLRRLFDSSPDAIVVADQGGRILDVSRETQAMFGYSRAELQGQPVEILVPERFWQKHERHREGYAADPRTRPMGGGLELSGRRKDGTELPVDVMLAPVQTAEGTVVLATLRDITERKRREEELRLLQEMTQAVSESEDFQAAVETALGKVCGATGWLLGEAWVPSSDGTCLERSPAWYSSIKDLEKFRKATEGITFPRGVGLPGRVWASKQPAWIRDVTLDPNFPRAPMARDVGLKAGVGIPVLANDQVVAVMSFFVREAREEDEGLLELISTIARQLGTVFRRKQAEEEIRRLNEELEQRVIERTAALESAKRELEAFTYTVSHDLKAPLRGIDGFSRALLEDYADRLEPEGRRYAENVRAATRRMDDLIEDLLKYSRLERRAIRWSPVDLAALCGRILEDRHPQIEARGLTVRLQLTAPPVKAEPEGLREALANLVDNAVKFSRQGGTITISAEVVDHLPPSDIGAPAGIASSTPRDSSPTAEHVLLAVGDDGIGFDMKYHERIFEMFQRLHRAEDYEGTGVGLAIVKKVAERHGGRAWATSELGKGSTFYLAIPMREGE